LFPLLDWRYLPESVNFLYRRDFAVAILDAIGDHGCSFRACMIGRYITYADEGPLGREPEQGRAVLRRLIRPQS
jgi:hypothetical protein